MEKEHPDTINTGAEAGTEGIESPDWRYEQTSASRLCEYLTGMRPDDPKMAERLRSDQMIIRTKYGLPDYDNHLVTRGEEEQELRSIATKLGYEIRDKSEMQAFFEAHPFAGGFHEAKDKLIVGNPDKMSKNYAFELNTLRHELIHAMQAVHSPRMPIELQEYEAYVENSSFKHHDELRDNPEELAEDIETFFQLFIGGSVKHWYNEQSRDRGEDVKPEWDDPEYFIELDRLKKEQEEENAL